MRETQVTVNDLIQPLFIKHGQGIKQPILSMPGQYQWSVDQLDSVVAAIVAADIPAVFLFGIPEHKDPEGSAAWAQTGVIQQAIARLKQLAPDLLLIADLCFCEYTDHGHCGVLTQKAGQFEVDNDATLVLLQKQAVSLAEAGADIVAPSGMMDGMVAAVRTALDTAGHTSVGLWSYAVKYTSAFYGPFREAAEGAPQFGDRKTYQMDPASGSQALREAALDIAEGADALIVKPAHTYLDSLYQVKQASPGVPIGAYHVSGEYAMLKAASASGWLDESRAVLEVLTSMKRAGADFIITYYALEAASWLR